MSMICLLTSLLACGNIPEDEMNTDYYINEISPPHADKLIFDVNFDEGTGNKIIDLISKSNATIDYVFSDAKFKGDEDPRWIMKSAASGYALAFDGYSNKASFSKDNISISGKNLTIDLFVAPRMFEWSAPGDFSTVQTILGQSNRVENEGFLIGMHKYGDFTFQIGLGDRWVELWNEWNTLDRYTWNHLTFIFDGDQGVMAMYKNGELINERHDVFGSIEPCDKDLLIGHSNQPQHVDVFELNMFNGLMDEIKIFQTTFTEPEIELLHSNHYIDGKIRNVDFNDAWLDESILEDDIYRPVYHANPPQHWMNEPHGLFYYNGYWHLFYQFNLTGPYWGQIAWGHWVSEDLINWINVKEAIILDENNLIRDGAWSGGASYKADGTPVLFITAGDDAHTGGLYSNQNCVVAVPKDLNDPYLIDWVVEDSYSAIQTSNMGKPNEFRDFNIYQENSVYYMVATAALNDGTGSAHLFTTSNDDFLDWTYQGLIFDLDNYPEYLGSSWELVNLVKVKNKADTISKYLFVLSPAGNRADNDVYYFLGNFDKQTYRFTPETEEPMLMDYGENVFTGPTISVDPNSGRVIICSITQDQRSGQDHYDSGWAHNAGMPKELWLNDDGDLIVLPIEEAYDIIGETLYEGTDLSSSQVNEELRLHGFNSQTLYVRMSLTNENSTFFGLSFKRDIFSHESVVYYDTITQMIMLDTRLSGNQRVKRLIGHPFNLYDDSTLEVEIFIDHSMVEIYINQEKTITASIYNLGTDFQILTDGTCHVNYISIHQIKGV